MKSTPGAKPLSAADLKNVFLNIEQLASAADELASEFEKAVGEEDANAGPAAREGDAGTDRMGEVFTCLVSGRGLEQPWQVLMRNSCPSSARSTCSTARGNRRRLCG